MHHLNIAVLIPCYNEETAITQVITDFSAALPDATIYVYDNNSSDATVEKAKQAGAIVHTEKYQGKGNVVRRMFADIEADIYLMIDGDATYHAPSAPKLIDKLIDENLDMVNGRRISDKTEAYRQGHQLGNRVLTSLVAHTFGRQFKDMLSGYRVFSRRYVKSFPAFAGGFEIETELTIHALELRMPVAEVDTPYDSRPEGSESKLSTYRDGFRILRWIFFLTKEERPLQFFSAIAAILAIASLVLAWPIFITFLETGLVPRFPTAILSTGLMLLGVLSAACGLILNTVTNGRKEAKRLHYLAIESVGHKAAVCRQGEKDKAC